MASRPGSASEFEIEAADDFLLGCSAPINSASLCGPTGFANRAPLSVSDVTIEIYRVFPHDSNGRSPNFLDIQVLTRVNSPSDVAFDARDSAVAGS